MSRTYKTLFIFLFTCAIALCQLPVSIGVKGGVGLTDAYGSTSSASISAGSSLNSFQQVPAAFQSDSKDYIVGPFIDVRLPLGLGVEADALYRGLHLQDNLTSPVVRSTNTTWEFPILAKYTLRLPVIKPYVDAGPSFRTTTDATRYLSNKGVAAGIGVDIHALFIHISPEMRYTHWGTDSIPSGISNIVAHSDQNQAEFLVGISF